MTKVPPVTGRVYSYLVNSPNLAADRAILGALPVAEPQWQTYLLQIVLQRGHTDILSELIEEYSHYPKALQELILHHARDLSPILRVAMASPVRDKRLTAIQIVADSGCLQLAWLLAGGVSSACPRTREQSAIVLESQAKTLSQSDAFRKGFCAIPKTPEQQRFIAARSEIVLAVRQGLNCWASHHRPEIVRAAMLLAEYLETEIIELVDNPRAKISNVFEESLTSSPGPELAHYLWRSLKSPRLRAKALRTFETSHDPNLFKSLMENAWILSDPNVASQLVRIRKIQWLENNLDLAIELPPRLQPNLVKFIQLSGIEAVQKIKMLEELANSSQPHLEEEAILALTRIPHPDVVIVLKRLLDWQAGMAAIIIEWELMRRNRYAKASEANSATPENYESFEDWWKHIPGMNRSELQETGHRMQNALGGFERHIREKLASSELQVKRLALHVVRTLSLTAETAEQIYKLAHDPDPMIRSGIAKAMISLDNPTTRRILRTLLNDADSRVQANTIEAMGELDMREQALEIEKLLCSPSSRVRATAVRFLLKLEVRAAAQTLLSMLDEPSRANRLSALWVIENLPVQTLADHVEQMASHDPDPGVRKRASRVVRSLGTSLNLSSEYCEAKG